MSDHERLLERIFKLRRLTWDLARTITEAQTQREDLHRLYKSLGKELQPFLVPMARGSEEGTILG
jgi:hypothetical protein